MTTPVRIGLLVIATLAAEPLYVVTQSAHFVSYSSMESGQNSAKRSRSKKGSTVDRNERAGPEPIDPEKPGGPRGKGRHHKKARKHYRKS